MPILLYAIGEFDEVKGSITRFISHGSIGHFFDKAINIDRVFPLGRRSELLLTEALLDRVPVKYDNEETMNVAYTVTFTLWNTYARSFCSTLNVAFFVDSVEHMYFILPRLSLSLRKSIEELQQISLHRHEAQLFGAYEQLMTEKTKSVGGLSLSAISKRICELMGTREIETAIDRIRKRLDECALKLDNDDFLNKWQETLKAIFLHFAAPSYEQMEMLLSNMLPLANNLLVDHNLMLIGPDADTFGDAHPCPRIQIGEYCVADTIVDWPLSPQPSRLEYLGQSEMGGDTLSDLIRMEPLLNLTGTRSHIDGLVNLAFYCLRGTPLVICGYAPTDVLAAMRLASLFVPGLGQSERRYQIAFLSLDDTETRITADHIQAYAIIGCRPEAIIGEDGVPLIGNIMIWDVRIDEGRPANEAKKAIHEKGPDTHAVLKLDRSEDKCKSSLFPYGQGMLHTFAQELNDIGKGSELDFLIIRLAMKSLFIEYGTLASLALHWLRASSKEQPDAIPWSVTETMVLRILSNHLSLEVSPDDALIIANIITRMMTLSFESKSAIF